MTVEELIKELREYPPDAYVVIDGYEGGVNLVNSLTSTFLVKHKPQEWYYGRYQKSKRKTRYPAVYIAGSRLKTVKTRKENKE